MVNPQNYWDQFSTPAKTPQANTTQNEPMAESRMQNTQQPPNEQSSFSWDKYQTPETYQGKPDPTADESTFGWLTRNVISNAARVGEATAGKYGDVQSFAKGLLEKVPSSLGILGKALHELVGPETWKRLVSGPVEGGINLPTTQQLGEATDMVTGGYTKPKTENERRLQTFSSDVGSTLNRRSSNARHLLVNNLGIPAAANVVKETVKGLGFGEDKGTVAKLGAWTALSLLGNVNGRAFAAELTNRGRQGLPQGLTVNVPRYQNRINALNRQFQAADPASDLARQQVAGIESDLANGQTSIQFLMNRYDAINRAKRSRGMFELNRADRNAARANIDRVLHAVRDEIMDVGRNYPQAIQDWRNGIQAFSVIHRSNAITNWVDGLIKGPYAKALAGPALGLFGVGGGYAGIKAPLVAGPAAAAGAALYKGGQIAYRVWQDPRLARYYWNSISAATEENAPAFIKNVEKMNKALEEKKEKSIRKPVKPNNEAKTKKAS